MNDVGKYRYLSEKLQAAVGILMIPVSDPSRALADAFHECLLALKDLGQLPESDAETLRQRIERAIDTTGIAEHREGTWYAKAEQMSDEEVRDFSAAVHELAVWADRQLWSSSSADPAPA
jgi:hypothetical protein